MWREQYGRQGRATAEWRCAHYLSVFAPPQSGRIVKQRLNDVSAIPAAVLDVYRQRAQLHRTTWTAWVRGGNSGYPPLPAEVTTPTNFVV